MAEAPFGHESSAIAVRRVLLVGASLATVVIVAVSLIHIALAHWILPGHAQVMARPAAIPPAPRLQPSPQTDIAELRRQKEALLSSWSWTDPHHDFARIPIERAMALYAAQHERRQSSSSGADTP